jgi:CRISPR system Cascade subunit CasB
MAKTFEFESPATKRLWAWWHGLDEDRGARAQLRRCHNLLAVEQTPAFHAVRQVLAEAGLALKTQRQMARLPAVIALLAHLKASTAQSLPQAFSQGDKPVVSPLRFRQLLDARDDEELFTRLRRVLPLIDKAVDPIQLANDVMDWGDVVRRRWVYAYRWPTKQTA